MTSADGRDQCSGGDRGDGSWKDEDRQVRGLIDALLAVSASLDVDGALRIIVDHAARLVGAGNVEMEVLGEAGASTYFLGGAAHVGYAELHVHRSEPCRFLKVPVLVGGCLFGYLHLSSDAGSGGFTERDQLFVRALASAAGIAIENSRMYAAAKIRQSHPRAKSDVATACLRGVGPEPSLQMIADKSLILTDSSCAFIAVAEHADHPVPEAGNLVIAVASGAAERALVGRIIPVADSTSGQAYQGREPVISTSLEYDQGIDDENRYGPAMALPLRDGRGVLGVLTVLKDRFAPQYDHNQLALMTAFADQAAVALHLAESGSRIHEISLLSERERIARDLHDHVIQRVFAVGLSVQGTLKRARSPEVRRRLQGTTNDLQEIIQDIRRTIFDLHEREGDRLSLRARLHEIVSETTADAELRVALHVNGPVSVIEAELSTQVEAVLREALSNVVQHAHASAVAVELSIDDDLSITVEDDGVGFAPDIHWSGLTNLAARAAELGGTFMIQPGSRAGSLLAWTVPIP